MQGGGSPTATSRVRSFEAVMKVLGPEEHAIRAGLEVSLQCAQEEAKKPTVEQRSSRSPDSVVAAAREKVAKLEKVLEVLEGRCDQERTRQGTSCGTREASGSADCGVQGFCQTWRETLAQVGSRKSCRNRFVGAKLSTSCPVGGRSSMPVASATPTNSCFRVGSGSFPSPSGTRTAPPTDQPGDQFAKPRLREDFVPHTVEEAGLWLKCRISSGRCEIGNRNCGGSSPVTGVDSTPLPDVRHTCVLRRKFFTRSSWNLSW